MGSMGERTQPRLDNKKPPRRRAVRRIAAVATMLMASSLASCSTSPNNGPDRIGISQNESAADLAERLALDKIRRQVNNPEAPVQIIAEPLVVTEEAKQRSALLEVVPAYLDPKNAYDGIDSYNRGVQGAIKAVNATQDPIVRQEGRAYLDVVLSDGVAGSTDDYDITDTGDNAGSNERIVALRREQANLIKDPVVKKAALAALDLNIALQFAGVREETKNSKALKALIISGEYGKLANKASSGDEGALKELEAAQIALKELREKQADAASGIRHTDAVSARLVNSYLDAYNAARKLTPGEAIPAYKDIAFEVVNSIHNAVTFLTAKKSVLLIPSAEVQAQMKDAIDGRVLYFLGENAYIDKLELRASDNAKVIASKVEELLAMANGMYSAEAKALAVSLLSAKLAGLYVSGYYGTDKDERLQKILEMFDNMGLNPAYKALARRIMGGAEGQELTDRVDALMQKIGELPANNALGRLYTGSNRQARAVNTDAETYLAGQR